VHRAKLSLTGGGRIEQWLKSCGLGRASSAWRVISCFHVPDLTIFKFETSQPTDVRPFPSDEATHTLLRLHQFHQIRLQAPASLLPPGSQFSTPIAFTPPYPLIPRLWEILLPPGTAVGDHTFSLATQTSLSAPFSCHGSSINLGATVMLDYARTPTD
jgi:hypothetical protein